MREDERDQAAPPAGESGLHGEGDQEHDQAAPPAGESGLHGEGDQEHDQAAPPAGESGLHGEGEEGAGAGRSGASKPPGPDGEGEEGAGAAWSERPPAPAVLRSSLIEFELRAEQEASLPRYVGSTLRGAIGVALRERSCVTGAPTCDRCPHWQTCHYGRVWESPPQPEGPRRFADPPRAYVLDPFHYGARSRFLPGDRLAFRLRVFGPAIDRVPWIILAIRDAALSGLGRGRARFRLIRASAFDDQREPLLLYANDRMAETARLGVQELRPVRTRELSEPGRVTLQLETPLHLTDQGATSRAVDPVVFSTRLLDRFDALLHFYEDATSGIDRMHIRRIAGLARVVHHDLIPDAFRRHSQRAGRVPMEGLLGRVTFDHVVPELFGLWKLGEVLHVGKQTTFGFGKVRVLVEHVI